MSLLDFLKRKITGEKAESDQGYDRISENHAQQRLAGIPARPPHLAGTPAPPPYLDEIPAWEQTSSDGIDREIPRKVDETLTNLYSSGKEVCYALKKQRQMIADANGIPYQSKPCYQKGPCPGTCPACDAEARYLAGCINKKREHGEPVVFVDMASDTQDNFITQNNFTYGGFQMDINPEDNT